MSTDDFGSSYLERPWEAPEEVVLKQEIVRKQGLQPEDLGVLAELLLRDPRLPSTMEAIRADMQARGWKMGKDRYNTIAERLTAAGHLARVPAFDEATQRPTWVTRVYRNPSNNEQYVDLGVPASEQVRTETRVSRDPGAASGSESRETRVSPGQSRIAGFPQSGAESRETRDLETRVSPGQSRNAENPRSVLAPPTPPRREEEDSSSPNPSAAPAGAVTAFDPERVALAAELLAGLPGRWACGRRTAGELAPLLAEAAASQGWELGRALASHLSRATRRRAEHKVVLRERIEDLPRYAAVRAVSPAAPRQELLPDAAVSTETAAAGETPSAAAPVNPEAVGKARELLLSLTGPWELSPESAGRLAPLLAAKALERGWAFDGELREKLMQNPGGAHNHELLLETHRIGRLPYRKQPPARPGRPGSLARQAAIDACGRCDAWGQYEIDGRYALCRHDAQPDASGIPAQTAPQEPEVPSAASGEGTTTRNLRDLLNTLHQPAV